MGDAGLPPEEPDPPDRLVGEAQPGIPMGAVDDEPGAQLGLGIDAFVGQCGRIGGIGLARQHRPALDQDQLAGDRHERADMPETVRLERREGVEVGIGQAPSGTVRTSIWRASIRDSRSASGPSNSATWTWVAVSGRRPSRSARPVWLAHHQRHQLASSARRSSSPNSGSRGASW